MCEKSKRGAFCSFFFFSKKKKLGIYLLVAIVSRQRADDSSFFIGREECITDVWFFKKVEGTRVK